MSIGLRFYTKSMTLGTYTDWLVPDEDMPNYPVEFGYDVHRNVLSTPEGNSYLYDRGKTKNCKFIFEDIVPLSKTWLEHICHGWVGSRQVTILFFGSSVWSTTTTPGSLNSVDQCIGTGYCTIVGRPQEGNMDLWTLEVEWTQFGPNQIFS